jgi:hypothetical protein
MENNSSSFSKKSFAFGVYSWRNEKGQLHRLDGPAIEFSCGTKAWYKDGQLHRVDGPAVESPDKTRNEWHLEGRFYSDKNLFFESLTDSQKEQALFCGDFYD